MLHNIGLDGSALAGRLVEDGYIADTAHSHIQRSRYGCRREHKRVDVFRHLAQLLLLNNAEALLLIYDEKSEIAELQAFREQGVRAYKKINSAALGAL